MDDYPEMSRIPRVCVIIPTKNRPRDLQRAVRSLFAQTAKPGSVIIVDQSTDGASRLLVEAEAAAAGNRRSSGWRIQYVRDSSISGAATARNHAMAIADGDIWLFLDDDVVLEPDFVEQLIVVYRDRPEVSGVSGVITNYRRPSVSLRLWNAMFVRGPFRDERQPIYWRSEDLRTAAPIRVPWFTGCLMSFRAEVIGDKRFDENLRGVSDGEDVDFCIQLGPAAILVIAPRARLEHWHSSVGRPRDHWLRRSVRGKLFLYHKNWNHGLFNRLCYWWLLAGFYFVALVACMRRRSLEPWRALRTGEAEASRTIRQPHRASVEGLLQSNGHYQRLTAGPAMSRDYIVELRKAKRMSARPHQIRDRGTL